MNLGDLKNPKAAEAAFKAHRRKFSAKVCLAPDTSGCGGGIISAHTLSLKAMLTPIARAGHVYTPVAELFRPAEEAPVQFKLQGLRDTSVFNGFCSVHDAALFDPIENKPFAASREQAFLHAFRAVAKESYLKRKQAEGPMSLETIREIHGFGNEADFSSEMQLHLAASLRGAEEIERVKRRMDDLYRASDWDRLVTKVIPLGVTPPVVASFIYSPDFDFAGNALQNFGDFSVDLDQLFVTVLPAAGGIGYALISHFDTVGLGPRQLVSSLLGTADVSSALLWLLLNYSENIAIAPVWFEALGAARQKVLADLFLDSADPFNMSVNRLKGFQTGFDDWKPGRAFAI